MKNILIFGAGKSTSFLIKYLVEYAEKNDWKIVVVDKFIDTVNGIYKQKACFSAFETDIFNDIERRKTISECDICVSMMPPSFHLMIAKDCLNLKKHFVTASYVSEEMYALNEEVLASGLIFMNEIGLDPGIDHMSAMEIIDKLKNENAKITSFKSYCGGLVAPKSDNNPWHYKISWNPRNIVLAGKDGADYLKNGVFVHENYRELFRPNELVEVPNYGTLAYYPNRNSVPYKSLYNLSDATEMMRATFRHPDFCEAWHVVVNLNLTDEKITYNCSETTFKKWVETQANLNENETIEERINLISGNNRKVMELISWLGIFEDKIIGENIEFDTASILQKQIEQKWKLENGDLDLIVLQHDFEYELNGESKKIKSTLIVEGESTIYTAMAKTVGLPLAIFVKNIINAEDISAWVGVQIPTMKSVYEPVLEELKEYGIIFSEQHS
jgi:saccharopine dehydrogenase-like NADP-dependent oxidoreductase